ncbi:hypothetical protein [Kitasatospora sp. NPDC007106]|uniref:hypothetical protein n=1 Tax=Kitasatospora sp. NPDC007106 TaxID=3156914 RepID=UPI0033C08E79
MKLNLKVVEISGTWEPNDAERRAAWELYVELVTRVAVVPLRADEGLLREALSSLYSLFTTTREVLRKYGPEVAEPKKNGQYNFGYLAVAMLNYGIRPLLASWHPALEDWESKRPGDRSRRDHEQAWLHGEELRTALRDTRDILTTYADLLATACGVPNLLEAVPTADR